MFRPASLVKVIHLVLSVGLTALLVGLYYEVVSDRITLLSWISAAVFLTEGLILLAFGWRCPLTLFTESLGSHHGRVTDLFMPKWLADRAFQVYGAMFGTALILLAVRLAT
jgi:hypothetical protein